MEKTEKNEVISIIIPVFNIEKYVEKCIKSVVDQTYNNIEIIIVDDGSTDNSGLICDKYAEIDSRIKVIHKENGGLSDARNVGLDKAKGNYIGFVDGDDYIHPQMYEILLKKIGEDKSDIVVCGCITSDDPNFLSTKYNTNHINGEVITGENYINRITQYGGAVAWNKLYRKEVFESIRYPLNKLHEDEFVLFDIFFKCKQVSVISKQYPLYSYVIRDNSIMHSFSEKSINDALDSFEYKLDFVKTNNWESVYIATIDKYCEYCITKYFELANEKDTVSKKYRQTLMKKERELIKRNFGKVSKRYVLFAINPALYKSYKTTFNNHV